MSFGDWLVVVPLVPAILVSLLWWLPWESWLPWEKMARTFLGPYLIYASFAAWYFDWGGWYALILLLAGLGFSVVAIVRYRSQK